MFVAMDDIQSSHLNGNFSTLVKDPVGLLQLLNKYVKVQLIKETAFKGFVHSIDPVHSSIILLIPEVDDCKVNIIPGHAILDVREIDAAENFNPQKWKETSNATVDISKRKEKLMAWLTKNLLPFVESEDKIIFQNVTILPPYGFSDICTNNPVVAMQIRKIIMNMPEDFNHNDKYVLSKYDD